MKIKVEGDSVTSWVNGVEMVSLDDKIIGEGVATLLQIHDGGGIRLNGKISN